jgi:glycopeptide antibiotics resistance protein
LLLLACWTAAIVIAVVPMGRYRERPDWQQIAWIPFVSWPVTFSDIVRNVLLYVPFGYLQARALVYPTARRALAHTAALSAGTEATQVYSRGRYPSATDVVCNVIGAMMGFAWARRLTSRASYRTAGTPSRADR